MAAQDPSGGFELVELTNQEAHRFVFNFVFNRVVASTEHANFKCFHQQTCPLRPRQDGARCGAVVRHGHFRIFYRNNESFNRRVLNFTGECIG